MQIEPSDTKTWLPGALTAVIGLLASLVAWIWARLVGQQDRHELRLLEIEKNMASKGDIAYLAERITESAEKRNEQNSQILKMLADRDR